MRAKAKKPPRRLKFVPGVVRAVRVHRMVKAKSPPPRDLHA
jgi:hypothetical protein